MSAPGTSAGISPGNSLAKPRFRRRPAGRAAACGFALVVAMIFLVLLTLVALAAVRSSGLEARMSANNAARMTAFESSELPRTAVSGLIDALCHAGGWPAAIGGEGTDFDAAIPLGLTIADNNGDRKPDDWCDPLAPGFDPDKPANSATFALNYPGGAALASPGDVPIQAEISVQRLTAAAVAGAGQAQVSGYSTPGTGTAGAGGNLFFYINSHGAQKDPAGQPQAGYNTSSVFRYVIRN